MPVDPTISSGTTSTEGVLPQPAAAPARALTRTTSAAGSSPSAASASEAINHLTGAVASAQENGRENLRNVALPQEISPERRDAILRARELVIKPTSGLNTDRALATMGGYGDVDGLRFVFESNAFNPETRQLGAMMFSKVPLGQLSSSGRDFLRQLAATENPLIEKQDAIYLLSRHDVEYGVKTLQDRQLPADLRAAAAEGLSEIPSDETPDPNRLRPLSEAALDKSNPPEVRRAAAKGATSIGDFETSEKLLRDPDSDVEMRRAAVEGVGRGLESADPKVRARAVESLGRVLVVQPDADEKVRRRAANGLKATAKTSNDLQIVARAQTCLSIALQTDSSEDVRSISAQGMSVEDPRDRQALVDAHRTLPPNEDVTLRAIPFLETDEIKEIAQAKENSLGRYDLQKVALEELSVRGEFELPRQYANDDSNYIRSRSSVLATLVKNGDDEGARQVWQAVSQDPKVRAEFARSIGTAGAEANEEGTLSARGTPLVIDALKEFATTFPPDSDYQNRQAEAVRHLSKFMTAGQNALSDIATAEEATVPVRNAAVDALIEQGKNAELPPSRRQSALEQIKRVTRESLTIEIQERAGMGLVEVLKNHVADKELRSTKRANRAELERIKKGGLGIGLQEQRSAETALNDRNSVSARADLLRERFTGSNARRFAGSAGGQALFASAVAAAAAAALHALIKDESAKQ